MTEDEAKTKWCPFVRFTTPPHADYTFNNRVDGKEELEAGPIAGGNGSASRCIGSACMAWREQFGLFIDGRPIAKGEVYGVGRETFGKVGGYCGLAGNP